MSQEKQSSNIAIMTDQRPYWTIQNSRGNCGPHLTNRELKKYGLLVYKKYTFDEVWFESNKGRKRKWMERFVDRWFYWI